VIVVRYANDMVAGFQYLADAHRFLAELKQRLEALALEVHPEIELDRIRRSAAVLPFGMCPEPSSIKPGDMPKPARHPAAGCFSRRERRSPASQA
jgi:hypothetical protein